MAFKTSFPPGAVDTRDLRFRPADPAEARTLRANHVETFSDGFVTGIPVFTTEEITDLREYVADLIDDADTENAATEFVPGSHRLCPLPHADKPLDGTRVLKQAVINPESYGTRFVNELKAGEISLHSDRSSWPRSAASPTGTRPTPV